MRIFHKFEKFTDNKFTFSYSGYTFFQTFSVSENSRYFNITLREIYRKGMISSSEVSFSPDLILFTEPFFSDKPVRFLKMVCLHDMPYTVHMYLNTKDKI